MPSNPFEYDISKGWDSLFEGSIGQCPECGNDVIGEDEGYEVCLGCGKPFHVEGCLSGRYLEGIGFWCNKCIDDGKHTEICPECGEETKDFTYLDDHGRCGECQRKWQFGELDWQGEEETEL